MTEPTGADETAGAGVIAGTVVAVCRSDEKGTPKTAVEEIQLRRGHGVETDAHAGTWHRQVSLLAAEQIEIMRAQGLELDHGAFGENIVTEGIDLDELQLGRRLRAGDEVVLQVTQHGKECHTRCAIYHQTGDCIMPAHGLFARVLRGGVVRGGDQLTTDPELDRYRYAVLTISDRGAAGARQDTAGPLVAELVEAAIPARRVSLQIRPDDRGAIEEALIDLCDRELCDLVLTTGGTGLSPRDVTPEATRAVIEREIPGMAEAMRAEGMRHTPRAMLSRAICGQRGHTMIVNLSGSPKAVREQLGALTPVLEHALETSTGIPQNCARSDS
ncbi:MAG: MOSC domain-containing protein [Deltaproteobacteria bacterium]|jgi:molybdenum cofactor synthesis domain-containing protein|nr:MOSC domain-containing protein [Deltaproteobacteria bacterium]MBW2530687.1 MOSC domain-containing protein [Deltaproteobacteria bacterium]